MIPGAMKLGAELPQAVGQVIGIWIAAALTLSVLSFLVGDNAVFRFTEYLFVGVSAGYFASLAWNDVLYPRVVLFLSNPSFYWHYGLFFMLGAMLLTRGLKSIGVLGNLPLGVLFGVGAALALAGALTGSLVPQMRASIVSISPVEVNGALVAPSPRPNWPRAIDAFLLVAGTIAVLGAFHFTAPTWGFSGPRRLLSTLWHRLASSFMAIGRGLIMVAFGALLAGAMYSFLAILQSRIFFLIYDWLRIFTR
jgi:hypothetical protein